MVRSRLLARRSSFWAGSSLPEEAVRALHDPVFFHQFGGFGAVALTPDDADAGYLLGVVSADRLAVLHALAVDPAYRRRGLGTALVERFAHLATTVGARIIQAVVDPSDPVTTSFGARFGAAVTRSPDHAGPGADRLVLTRSLPLG